MLRMVIVNMISFNLIKKTFIVIGILAFLSSCCKAPDKWDKDYYDYHIGAYINGVEFHEYSYFKIAGPSRWFGFVRSFKENWVYLSFLSNDPYIASKPHSHELYCLSITVAIDSAFYRPGQPFCFDNQVFESHKNIEICPTGEIFDLVTREYISGPWCVCYLHNEEDDEEFIAVDGWISFGEFSQGNLNSEMIRFECSAVNEKGDTLHITNGFVNKFSYD